MQFQLEVIPIVFLWLEYEEVSSQEIEYITTILVEPGVERVVLNIFYELFYDSFCLLLVRNILLRMKPV